MKPIAPSQIAAFHALLKQHGIQDQKAEIVQQLSNNRASSTKELFSEEIQPWINQMNKLNKPAAQKSKQQMINTIIAAAHEMGWIRKETIVQPDGSIKTMNNYDHLNKWINEKGYLKKPLNDYTYNELPKLVTAFRNVYASWLQKHH